MEKRSIDTVLVRMDKIGDLVLSLVVDEHPAFLGQRVHWFVSQGMSFITDQAAPKRMATEFQRRFSPFEFRRMVRWFRLNQPLTVVLLHCPWWVSMAAWWAGVPERLGRKSQWHSYLFLNVPIRQKRSLSDRHESDFNFDLVEAGYSRLGVRGTSHLSLLKRTFLRLMPPNPFATVNARGLREREYRVVHPGMAGSALNWPQASFRELIMQLAEDRPVLITGTKMDQKYLAGLSDLRNHRNVHWMVDELKVYELLDLLSQARSVIAPSTGVLHLAASLGAPVVGIYSPRVVEHPRRWGPKGLHAAVLVPDVQDGDAVRADVMNTISVEQVLNAIRDVEKVYVRADASPQPGT